MGASLETITLNAEAGPAPSPSGDHRCGAWCCVHGPCRGPAALPSFQGSARRVSGGWSPSPPTLHCSVCREQVFPAAMFS